MPEGEETAPVVRMPERVDRRARLGPFPSARDAARFLCYAAAGALAAPFVSPFLWLPVVGGGFVVSVWQPDGQPADGRAVAYLLWRIRARSGGASVSPRSKPSTRHRVVPLASGAHAAVVRAGGCPMAYLPPAALQRRFAAYRDLLRAIPGHLGLLATAVPIRDHRMRPGGPTPEGDEGVARAGYSELVGMLCARRRIRRVYLALRNDDTSADSIQRLDAAAQALADRLGELGLSALRLEGRALAEAADRFDWTRSEARG